MAPDLLAEPGQVGRTVVGLPIAGPGGTAGPMARHGRPATVARSLHRQVFPGQVFPGRGFPAQGSPGRPSAVPLTAPLRRWNSSRMVLAQK